MKIFCGLLMVRCSHFLLLSMALLEKWNYRFLPHSKFNSLSKYFFFVIYIWFMFSFSKIFSKKDFINGEKWKDKNFISCKSIFLVITSKVTNFSGKIISLFLQNCKKPLTNETIRWILKIILCDEHNTC